MRSCQDGFWSSLEAKLTPAWAHLGFLLRRPGAQKCNTYLGFSMFSCARFHVCKMPKVIPREPQEGFKRPREVTKGGPQGTKMGPRPPQDGPKTALRRPKMDFKPAEYGPKRPQDAPRRSKRGKKTYNDECKLIQEDYLLGLARAVVRKRRRGGTTG